MSAIVAPISSSETTLPVCLFAENPYRLVSLWDVLKQYSFSFFEVTSRLERLRGYTSVYESTSRPVYEHHRKELLECLPKMRKECGVLSLDSTADLTSHIESEVFQKGEDYKYNDFQTDLKTLSFSFSTGLKKCVVFRIEDEKKKYFQKDDLAGPKVKSDFPLCSGEITKAGNCYALEQDEACVFHCMCALELALHVLANELNANFGGTLDLQDWGTIIGKIESEIKKLEQLPKGRYKSDTLKFFSEAAMQFRWFKDAWRNHAMHGRGVYDEGLAFSVFGSVRKFVQALADGGLKE